MNTINIKSCFVYIYYNNYHKYYSKELIQEKSLNIKFYVTAMSISGDYPLENQALQWYNHAHITMATCGY